MLVRRVLGGHDDDDAQLAAVEGLDLAAPQPQRAGAPAMAAGRSGLAAVALGMGAHAPEMRP